MKFIFGVLLFAFAVFFNSIEKSLQSGKEPPFPLKSKWRMSIGFKGFPKRPGSSGPERNNENSLQNRSRGPIRHENLSLERENKNISEESQHPAMLRSQFPKVQTSPKNQPQAGENKNHFEEYTNPPQKYQHPVKPFSKSKCSSKPKHPPRDPGDPDDPGVVFWLPPYN
ncbi:uncharacterized protein LOC117182330 [Belonocnema kinseyi]|uniref:uncharacterized protein LOC117182330 n=1 Tax=Belonocnema kinseyi TaxID=2817044 RepID=UPI00143DDF29|nr:uncharacterized protein LOC117182330 [Belonocnema kinseyi]